MDGLHLGSFASHSEHLRNIRAYEFVGHMLCTWDMGKSNGLFTSGLQFQMGGKQLFG